MVEEFWPECDLIQALSINFQASAEASWYPSATCYGVVLNDGNQPPHALHWWG